MWEGCHKLWQRLLQRPAWQTFGRVVEQLIIDALITIIFMFLLYCVSWVATKLGIDKEEVAFGFTIANIIHGLHGVNLIVNGYHAVMHLWAAHTKGKKGAGNGSF